MKAKLQHDLEVDGVVKYAAGSEFAIRRPKAKDMVKVGDHLPVLASLDREKPEEAMNGKVFAAMIALVAALTPIGDDAENLDYEDLVTFATEAFGVVGEAKGRGGDQPTGE